MAPNNTDAGSPLDDDSVWVEHSPAGTVVYGTDRGDRELQLLLRGLGFRWSRRLEGWYLPRTWSEQTRRARVQSLRADRPEIRLEESDQPPASAAEREQERRDRAAARAQRLSERASKARAVSEAREQAAEDIGRHIPFGQPVLVGHHSQRRHEKALERIEGHSRAAHAALRRAEDAEEGAERARRVASGRESIVRIGNRIERTEAELRAVDRSLRERASRGVSSSRLESRRAELVDQLDHDRAKLEDAGGVPYSRGNVSAGDFVRIRGLWFPVVRANQKTATVPCPMAPADSKSTQTAPWREVDAHLSRSEATAERVLQLAKQNSTAFPSLFDRLLVEARNLER